MPAPENRFKSRLAAGETLIGAWVGLGDAYAAEITATAGFDWLLIDGEHAPNDLRSILSQLRVVEGSASAPVVRLPMGETWAIKQALDIGAQSLLIPMVESAAQAEQLVRDISQFGIVAVGDDDVAFLLEGGEVAVDLRAEEAVFA